MDDTAIIKIKQDLDSINWDFINDIPINEAYNEFDKHLHTVIDKKP